MIRVVPPHHYKLSWGFGFTLCTLSFSWFILLTSDSLPPSNFKVSFATASMANAISVTFANVNSGSESSCLWICSLCSPHTSLKFPDIVKLNTCILFYDYFHHDKFPNLPVSLVSELHNWSTRSGSSNQVAIPSFRINLRRFCPSIIGSFFWNDILQSIRDKPSKKKV